MHPAFIKELEYHTKAVRGMFTQPLLTAIAHPKFFVLSSINIPSVLIVFGWYSRASEPRVPGLRIYMRMRVGNSRLRRAIVPVRSNGVGMPYANHLRESTCHGSYLVMEH